MVPNLQNVGIIARRRGFEAFLRVVRFEEIIAREQLACCGAVLILLQLEIDQEGKKHSSNEAGGELVCVCVCARVCV
jgi:hypothetical protein